MTRFLVAVALVLATTGLSRADWVLTASEDGGTFSAVTNGTFTTLTGTSFTGTFHDFAFNVNLVDNQSANGALLSLQSVTANNDGTTAHSLDLRLVDSNFTQPGGTGNNMNLVSNIASNLIQGTGTLSFQTLVNGVALTPLQTLVTIPGSNSQTANFTRGASFSLQNDTMFNSLSAGGQIQETGSSNVTAVPEPASIGLAMGGLGILGGFSFIRRKRS